MREHVLNWPFRLPGLSGSLTEAGKRVGKGQEGYTLDRHLLMPGAPAPEVTQLLLAWGQGDAAALDKLVPVVHAELRRIARRQMGHERLGHTLQPTALVNEAYLRLVDIRRVQWQDRAHFFAMSARVMRRVLVDAARARGYQKRGAGAHRVSLDESLIGATQPGPDLMALDDALTALAVIDKRKSQVVEMRFFGGLSVEETADALGVSERTVKRDWTIARLWLLREMKHCDE
jgi:RNA polymerase sigma-70 factor (ECF subfamily)